MLGSILTQSLNHQKFSHRSSNQTFRVVRVGLKNIKCSSRYLARDARVYLDPGLSLDKSFAQRNSEEKVSRHSTGGIESRVSRSIFGGVQRPLSNRASFERSAFEQGRWGLRAGNDTRDTKFITAIKPSELSSLNTGPARSTYTPSVRASKFFHLSTSSRAACNSFVVRNADMSFHL